jgi:hypothetical protein
MRPIFGGDWMLSQQIKYDKYNYLLLPCDPARLSGIGTYLIDFIIALEGLKAHCLLQLSVFTCHTAKYPDFLITATRE